MSARDVSYFIDRAGDDSKHPSKSVGPPIAQEKLTRSICSAETHRTNLMRKLGLHSVADLTLYAVRNGIVQVY
jgi:hypothetical protein